MGNYFYYQHSDTIRQDTAFRVTETDTLDAIPLGINPLFVQMERKAREVEAYKEQVAQEAQRRIVRLPRPKVDTTCTWCPTEKAAPLHDFILLANQSDHQFFKENLYDKQYYQNTIGSTGPVFVETAKTPGKEFFHRIEVKPREGAVKPIEWVIIPIFFLVFVLAFLKLFYRKYLYGYFEGAFNFLAASKQNREGSIPRKRTSLMLDLVFFTSLSVFAILSFEQFELDQMITIDHLTLGVFVFLGLLVFRIFRIITNYLVGVISSNSNDFEEYLYHQLIYPRIFGIIAIPFLAIQAYGEGVIRGISLYFLVSVFFILVLLRFFRSLQVFLNKGFSIFYFLLYLCALEIIPILVTLKEIFGK